MYNLKLRGGYSKMSLLSTICDNNPCKSILIALQPTESEIFLHPQQYNTIIRLELV